MGVGFAIPANMVRFVSDAAIAHGAIVRPWVGITVQPVTSDIADSLGLDAPRGALVTRVTEDSPASRIGIEVGDVILAFDSHPLESEAAFGYRLATKQIGETAPQLVSRCAGMALSKAGKRQHPQTLMKLSGELQLSPAGRAPHELDVNAVRLGFGVAHSGVTLVGTRNSTAEGNAQA